MQNQEDLSVVLVDDTPRITQLLAQTLNAIDHVTVTGIANNIQTALETIANLQPDVVILDIGLPPCDAMHSGIDVLRWIKHRFATMHVIMFTNYSDPFHQRLSIQNGAHAFLDKSRGLESLINMLSTLVTKPEQVS